MPQTTSMSVTVRPMRARPGRRRIHAAAVAATAALIIGACQGVVPSATHGGTSSAPGTTPAAPSAAVPSASPRSSATPTATLELATFAPLPEAALSPATAAELQNALDAAVTAGAPDAIAAVITADGSWAGAAGIGGPDGRKATAQDEFAIASVSKMFTAALVMRLVERGKIDLDASIATYLGDRAIETNGATVRQALGMRSGLPDFGPDVPLAIAADPAHHWTIDEIVARVPAPSVAAGTVHIPALANYVLLALAIEHVTGDSLAEALRTEVLEPIGATRILQQGAGVRTPEPWALPTEAHLGRFKVTDLGAGGAISCISSASFSYGGGGMASDAPSLAAWAWRLFAGDVVDRASLRAMVPSTDVHGLGIEQLRDLGTFAIGQTGAKTGYGTILAVFPAEQVVIALFVNDENYVVEPYVVQLLEAALAG